MEKYPDEWTLARVSPIFKAGLKTELGNYRPISVLSAVSKVFEKIIYINKSVNISMTMNYLQHINQDLGKVIPHRQHC
jgi:hypothetical protein